MQKKLNNILLDILKQFLEKPLDASFATIKNHVPQKKKKKKKTRIKFAETHLNWNKQLWKSVLWMDTNEMK